MSGKNKCSHLKSRVKTFVDGIEYFYSGDTAVNNAWDASQAEERLMQILDMTPVLAAIASDDIMLYKKGGHMYIYRFNINMFCII